MRRVDPWAGAKAGAVLCAASLAGCASTPIMESYVPEHCHGASAPFATYQLSYKDIPGFIEPVIDTALRGALGRKNLTAAPAGEPADVRMQVSFSMIQRSVLEPYDNEDEQGFAREKDSFGEPVMTAPLVRFVAHTDLDLYDNRADKLIWKGAIDRAHAIRGDETFHNDRAVLTISNTLDDMFKGLTTPCS